jgi:protein-L-isoaspartate O-methyltransferase
VTTQERPDLDWRPWARAYAEALSADDVLDPTWQKIFADVPRHVFVPRFWALDQYNSPDVEITGSDPGQRGKWLDAVYSNQALVTQWTPRPWRDRTVRVVTSSASEPGVVATMLDRLDINEHHRVLEIGTGSGYNAALLCARGGDDRVTSIDIDPVLVEDARGKLAEAGFRPRLHVGDGAIELAGGRQYDRIIATCAVARIPSAWITQLAPRGRLVVPLGWGGGLAVLDKVGDTEVTGRIDRAEVRFMWLRRAADEPMPARIAPVMPATAPELTHHGLTDVDPQVLDDTGFRLWLALHRPNLLITQERRNNAVATASVVYDQHERAAAARTAAVAGLWPVTQQGGRPWDSVETAWRSYERTGYPERDRLGLTARADGTQHVWLDEPASPYTWPVPDPAELP